MNLGQGRDNIQNLILLTIDKRLTNRYKCKNTVLHLSQPAISLLNILTLLFNPWPNTIQQWLTIYLIVMMTSEGCRNIMSHQTVFPDNQSVLTSKYFSVLRGVVGFILNLRTSDVCFIRMQCQMLFEGLYITLVVRRLTVDLSMWHECLFYWFLRCRHLRE